MEDYSKLSAAQLKDELKRRAIPQTGMTRKQQFIERLKQHDEDNKTTSDVVQPEDGEVSKVEEASATVVLEASEQKGAQSPDDGKALPKSPEDTGEDQKDEEVPGATRPAESSSAEVIENEQQPASEPSTQPSADNDGVAIKHQSDGSPRVQEDAKEGTPSNVLGNESVVGSASREETPIELQESMKRKRSQTPPLSSEEIMAKKLKPAEDAPDVVLKEDVAVFDQATEDHDHDLDVGEKVGSSAENRATSAEKDLHAIEEDTKGDVVLNEDSASTTKRSKNKYKDLLPARLKADSHVDPVDESTEATQEARRVEDPIHPPTKALYIRNIMRPLQPSSFKEHLIKLSGQSADELKTFYLDDIKTHGFVVFLSVAAATRVRNLLHDTAWPAERDRKPLWVDFIPEDKAAEWIQLEATQGETIGTGRNAGKRSTGLKRWEVVYEHLQDGTVEASLQEVKSGGNPARKFSGSIETMEQPRLTNSTSTGLQRTPTQATHPRAAPAVNLDAIFKSTTTRPKLYFQPVPDEIVTKRLEAMQAMVSPRSGPVENIPGDRDRFTFEDDFKFVRNGPEFGLRAERQRFRGGAPRGRRGRGDSLRM